MTTLCHAVMAYGIDIGVMPPNLDALLSPPCALHSPRRRHGPYITEVPVDPWGSPLKYQLIDGSDQEFRIWSCGRDRISGTQDDVVIGRDPPR
jgi:hypothetical protein